MKIKPKRLEIGNKIGIVSPASPSYYKSDIDRGIKTLKEWGFKVEPSKNLNKKTGFFSGRDIERAEDLNEMFERKDIDAIFVTQGGYGSAQVLKYLDFDLIRKNPKIFLGFSDITSLLLAINKITGIVTFHGPGMTRFNDEELTEYTKEHLFKALNGQAEIGHINLADSKKWINVINGGQAEGELIGGNLTLICSSLGTPYEIDTKDKILFFEEVDTEPWIFDHMMCHLSNAGVLQKASGFVIGECARCVPRRLDPGFHSDISLEDILEFYLKPLGKPVLHGLPIGHTKDLATLPIGVNAYINADDKIFSIEEAAVL
ncbi:MAG: LD-carboxypeptidase [Sedimentibacter sp.]|nr:LD-carboxypeptidase [Sedimentibacter sp.]